MIALPYGVPDELFFSDNEHDIPTLLLSQQADACEIPWIKWGVRARERNMTCGTIHFYTDDYKFSGLWKTPDKLLKTGVVTVVEPDYSTHDQTPRALFLASLYKKRWLARFWQKHGCLIVVNLNVNQRFAQDNLIGVPQGWQAYATRWNPDEPENAMEDYRLACNHAQSDKILFITYGGGRAGKAFSDSIKQPWIIDQAHEMRIKIYG